jgi:16S rRNA C1402 N4-methylase RsmH
VRDADIIFSYAHGDATARAVLTVGNYRKTPLAHDHIYGHYRYAWKLLDKIHPTQQEIAENPRSRSATLWTLEKLPV